MQRLFCGLHNHKCGSRLAVHAAHSKDSASGWGVGLEFIHHADACFRKNEQVAHSADKVPHRRW